MNKYEKALLKYDISDCVIAYRKIPISNNSNKGKCNVHFANEAFNEIRRRVIQIGTCTAITLDISKFFDSLDHFVIKKQWCRVLETTNGLPPDHYTVYKNIVNYRYVDAKLLQQKLRFKFKDLQKKGIKQICSPQIFREKVLPFLSDKNVIGIPQGTTISDVIANMYMLDFDIIMHKFALKYHGYYRRYSDDILLIIDNIHRNKPIKFIEKLIQLTGKTLKINKNKTLVSSFKNAKNKVNCQTYKIHNNQFSKIGKPFEYLGLSFDGNIKMIRQSTISKFYKKLSKRIKAEVKIAYSKLIQRGNIAPTQTEIFKIISFDMIRNSYMKNIEINDHFRGNFYTYAQLVAEVTGNSGVLNIFDGLSLWIKNRARKYCKAIVTQKPQSPSKKPLITSQN